MAPGGVGFVVARERYIDDFLITSLNDGLDQVVILGAGFDTRAYRIAGMQKTRVFEIDHPSTQAEKLKRLQKVMAPVIASVAAVAGSTLFSLSTNFFWIWRKRHPGA